MVKRIISINPMLSYVSDYPSKYLPLCKSCLFLSIKNIMTTLVIDVSISFSKRQVSYELVCYVIHSVKQMKKGNRLMYSLQWNDQKN